MRLLLKQYWCLWAYKGRMLTSMITMRVLLHSSTFIQFIYSEKVDFFLQQNLRFNSFNAIMKLMWRTSGELQKGSPNVLLLWLRLNASNAWPQLGVKINLVIWRPIWKTMWFDVETVNSAGQAACACDDCRCEDCIWAFCFLLGSCWYEAHKKWTMKAKCWHSKAYFFVKHKNAV